RVDGELALPLDSRPQRLAADVRHDVVEEGFDVTRIVKREDVRMLQPRQHSNFTNESHLAVLRTVFGVQDLHSDLTFVSGVVGEIYRRECALSDLTSDLV